MNYLKTRNFLFAPVITSIVLILVSSKIILSKRYTPDWNSIDSRPIPEWYNDAKFGIFMHLTTSVVPGKYISKIQFLGSSQIKLKIIF